MLFNLIGRPVILAAAFFLGAGTASARDLMGGSIPLTFAGGLFSGVGHPIISPDCLAFSTGAWDRGRRLSIEFY